MRKFIPLFVATQLISFTSLAQYRDPTQPGNLPAGPAQSVTPANSEAELVLSAILISDSSRRAIINGVSLKAGEKLDDDTRLVRIHPGHVLVRQHGITKKLYLVPSVKDR
ncbi:hypothetical protein IVG45_08670 [Methylomonas sp. LL1]|uniref:hypothetical protein n=1 Tax=Methylomonas sp. LL1 TaxID=2785785 RepID=UPI0018C38D16|nr:hypothetical protein [Methylomonas sp. LL1]QPK64993.1 hypothetical protein IVG45_08670 [Methylomonas sp. LL1]